jgi:hypothetical protein
MLYAVAIGFTLVAAAAVLLRLAFPKLPRRVR